MARFAPLFSDHMVLQRDLPVRVWGEAPDGEAVEARFAGQVRRAVAAGGRWAATFDPVPAGGPHALSVRDAATGEGADLADVWTGEVFVAGGQSNMAFLLKDSLEWATEAGECFLPAIRYYEVPRLPYEGAAWFEQREEYSFDGWEVCTPETAGHFSAVAYHAAKRIQAALGVPVGIVGCSWGGTSATCWMSEAAVRSDPDFLVYLDEYEADVAKQGGLAAAERNYDVFRSKVRDFREGRADGAPWEPPMGPRAFLRPCGLHGTMLGRVAPLAVRGVLWYQGESDAHHAALYRRLFARLIREWREDFGRPDLPFLFVQLASYENGNPDGTDWAELRESQRQVAREVPGAGMAVILDGEQTGNLHPPRKRPVGERLARLALRRIFSLAIEDAGPEPVAVERSSDGASARVRFAHADGGLVVRGGGAAVAGFAAVGRDGTPAPVPARADGDAVVVDLSAVPGAAELRYGFTNAFDPVLFNVQGLPGTPFRLDLP